MRYIICFLLLVNVDFVYSQTDKLNQFWNEYAFTKKISQNWTLELNAGLSTSSTPQDSNIFHNVTQVYVRGWVHYYPADRWKLSAFYAYYSNRNVPELNQKEAPEMRSAVQLTYNLLKEYRFKVNLRFRFEDRHLHNDNDYFEAVKRFRFQIKTVYGINGREIKKMCCMVLHPKSFFLKLKAR